ncbi:hypothetical protein LNP04_07105 [Chryseobacterium sp. C-71]|uniref:hypothetical protein n=1 Tax=Chryseobacterium sp. C-71 TaxID=2893882 RepID=UPI001E50530F|nr:hypothetical protein [Chryseobacterium sp. C-71]UFH33469.1 hypothetical protein LNP04_07105 [Chryseobacterium sp. C-71]
MTIYQKYTGLREAVVVINEDTSMFELQKLASELEKKLRIRIFQIAIHKDEGHYDKDSKEWIPNFHAHLVADWQDLKTGKTLKHTRFQYSQMQDIAAKSLGMERGEKKGVVRLEAINFKIDQKLKELDDLENKIAELSSTIDPENFLNLNETKSNFFGITKMSVEKTVENFINHAKTLNFELSQTKINNKVLVRNNDKLKSECSDLKNDILSLKNLNNLLLSNVELYNQKRREYLESIFKLLGKTILQERLKYPISVNTDTLNKTMSKICAKIAEKNKIPEVAIEEIFKVERNNRVLFRYLKDGKSIKHNIIKENSKDLKNDETINPQNFLRR